MAIGGIKMIVLANDGMDAKAVELLKDEGYEVLLDHYDGEYLLQKLKEINNDNALYISVDNPYFATINLYEFAKKFEQYGGEILFIDEIHKYKDIASHLKAIYDMTNLKVVVSGSSLLQIYKEADLSRRVYEIKVPVLSFREFLETKNYVINERSFDSFSKIKKLLNKLRQ